MFTAVAGSGAVPRRPPRRPGQHPVADRSLLATGPGRRPGEL